METINSNALRLVFELDYDELKAIRKGKTLRRTIHLISDDYDEVLAEIYCPELVIDEAEEIESDDMEEKNWD